MLESLRILYDSVLEESHFTQALEGLVPKQCTGAAVFLIDEHVCLGDRNYAVGLMVDAFAGYSRDYIEDGGPITKWLAQQPGADFVVANDFFPSPVEQYKNPLERWYRDVMGVKARSAARLNLHGGWIDAVTLTFGTDDRRVIADAHDRIRPLLSHLAKTLDLQRRFRLLRDRHNATLSALDYFDVGVAITDLRGEVVIANVQLQDMLSAADGLTLDAHRRLVASAAGSGQLGSAVSAAIETLTEGNGPSVIRLSLKRRSDAPDYVVDVSPIRQTSPHAEERVIGALVLVVDPTHRSAIRASSFTELFDLTRAELAVCELLLDGHDRNTMSEIRGVSPETIKTQIRSVLGKTQTRNRTDLVRLAVTVNPPILNRF